ncbi:MAG: 23S rRNA (pseudouridine(1915)-N(3))-methyltransferase RlmH [Gammaproteobacteria bacterium]|nr:23S rRNA (pseudouridine(1915)-N(3))-methyltransferase RlmH [Gammaproteobacteria bacterium]
MHIHLIAVGNRMPRWVTEGYQEYAKRLPAECALRLVEVAPATRGKSPDVPRVLRDECLRMLSTVPHGSRAVALDVRGQGWSTEQLAVQLAAWLRDGRDVSLLVGGPEGLAPECLARAELRWSLSPLTLPHPLVRVVVAEQLYRAWSIISRHPYHRA